MTQPARLPFRIVLLGLISGIGTGAALLVFARFGALLGDAGFYLVMAGGGWFTGKALARALALHDNRGQWLGGAFALAYAAGVDPLNALLVDASLTGEWLLASLWLSAIAAALASGTTWIVNRAPLQHMAVAALVGVAVMAGIVAAVNVIIGSGALLAGVWAIYLVPALWLPPVTYFCLKPLPQKPIDGL
jgi:hypothetical protein